MPPSGIYLSPTARKFPVGDLFGTLVGPRSYGIRGLVKDGLPWGMDNDCFNPCGLSEEAWTRAMDRYRPYLSTCLFVIVPDVWGDSRATLQRFKKYLPLVKKMGYPAALATQDGLRPDQVEWNTVDALFVGGTNEHKMGPEAARLIEVAQKKGKWVHVGRVNSRKRILQLWQADSWDGTCLCFNPSASEGFARAVSEARAFKAGQIPLL